MEEYGVSGKNLITQTKRKIYNIEKGDKFYEQLYGGIWLLNYSNTDEVLEGEKEPKLILEIVELNENTATIKENQTIETMLYDKNNSEPHSIGYNEEYKIRSRYAPVIDGPNYSYTIKIIKKN